MSSRPVVSVFDPENAESVVTTVSLPAVFTAPIRNDVVQYVHTLMAKNARQAYAVSEDAGHQVSSSFKQYFYLIFSLQHFHCFH
jgi:large subunit ribosomal protein L4e